jgi:uncharacterized protein YjbI with pentapeptide repeats
MYDANVKRQWTQNGPILTQTTMYPLKVSSVGESRLSKMQQSVYANEREDEFIRLYREGKRDFAKADLQGVNLQGVSLEHIRLIMADLREADLREANLRGAKLRGADLREADLRGTDLRGANLQDANLIGAKLAGAKLDDVTQIDPTWRLIWETVNHGGNGHKPGN